MMESDLLNEQINTLTSEYADTFRNINASSLTSVDVSSLESEIEALKSELVNAEEDLKWATNLIENAQKDMKEKNMGAIPNDPFFENNNKAKKEYHKEKVPPFIVAYYVVSEVKKRRWRNIYRFLH